MGRISEKTRERHRRTGSFIRDIWIQTRRTTKGGRGRREYGSPAGYYGMAMRIGGGGSNTGGASTLQLISHDSFREHTLLADTTNGDEQDHSVGGGANVRRPPPPPPQSKAYSSSISRRVLNCLVKKENQIKKNENQAPKRGKKDLPSGQQVGKYRYLPYLTNAPSSHTPATTRRLFLRTLPSALLACGMCLASIQSDPSKFHSRKGKIPSWVTGKSNSDR